MTAGIFSPIEDVIREAEQQAEAEWKREHEPCPHDCWIDVSTLNQPNRYMCRDCGERRSPTREPFYW